MVSIKNATESDIPLIRTLAEKIWWPTYSSIIKEEQIGYMLANLYSEHSLRDGMKNGEVFLLLHDKNGYQGFVSYSSWPEQPGTWKINKLYVLPENHGSGYGRKLVNEVLERARHSSVNTIVLNVNRYNPAFTFYKKLGFEVIREEDIPIGSYWMNDYVMKLDVSS
jgi:diamine N-acetyltransferase